MTKCYLILLKSVLLVFLISSVVCADLTLDNIDGSMGDEWNYYQETEDTPGSTYEVTPGYGGQDFDIEKIGLFIDDSTLYFGLQTGFDITGDNTIDSGGDSYQGGDFALDFGADGIFEFGFRYSIDVYGDAIVNL